MLEHTLEHSSAFIFDFVDVLVGCFSPRRFTTRNAGTPPGSGAQEVFRIKTCLVDAEGQADLSTIYTNLTYEIGSNYAGPDSADCERNLPSSCTRGHYPHSDSAK